MTFTLFEEHQQEIVRYGGIALARDRSDHRIHVVLQSPDGACARKRWPARSRSRRRRSDRRLAGQNLNFPTQEAKDQAATRAFTELQSQYSGKDEGLIASYYLGVHQGRPGQTGRSRKGLQRRCR